MSKLISTPKLSKKHQSDQISQQISLTSALLLPNGPKPFDDSIYDSNQFHHSSSKDNTINRSIRKTKRSHLTN